MNTLTLHQQTGKFSTAIFLLAVASILFLGCSSADNTFYTSGSTSRSFTDSAFDYEQLKIEKTFHVVNEEVPACSFLIEFLSESRISIRDKEYRYKIEEGRVVVQNPNDYTDTLVTFEVVSDNAGSSDYISAEHFFSSRDAAEESGLWMGTLPDSMPYIHAAKWYRTTARVGHSPTDILRANTDKGDFLYVVNSAGNSVSVIQTPENKVLGTIPVHIDPYRMAVSPDGSYVYVTNSWDNTVSVIQTASNTVVKNIRVGRVPNGIAVTADGAYVLVANTNDASISVIETGGHTVEGTIPMGPKALSYIEVFFSVPPEGRKYTVLAIENDCGALVREPDMSSPICQANSVSGECPTKCPASMGRVEMAFSPVQPGADGFWRTEFLDSQFKTLTYTLLLVENFSQIEGFDLDQDDNGIFDYQEVSGMEPPWDRIVDEVGVLDSIDQGGLYTNVVLPVVFRGGISVYVPGGYSRIPNGEDTNSKDDWVANNLFSCWLSPVYDDPAVIHLSDIPQPGRAFNSPGESNVWNDSSELVTTPLDHPVINEFMINRHGYTPLGLVAPKTLAPGEESFFYANTEENTLLKIRLSDYTIIEKVAAGDGLVDIALLPDGDLYIAGIMGSSVSVVRNGSVLTTISVGMGIKDIAASSDGKYVFVTNSMADSVTVIRASDQTIIDYISLGKDAVGITTPLEGNFFYVTNEDDNRVSVVTYTVPSGCE